MKLSSTRQLFDLKSVLKDPNSSGPDPAYWVFSEIAPSEKWANITIIAPGNYNGEYPKTFGHYHGVEVNEIYHVIEGEGVLQFQKRDLSKVYLIKAKAGDEIIITPEYGHSWSNIGKLPLILFDNWTSGHKPSDYEPIERLQGLSFYLIEKEGHPKAVPNPKYQNLPEPVWLTAEEFAKREK